MPKIPTVTQSSIEAMVMQEKMRELETTAVVPSTLAEVRIGRSASHGPKMKMMKIIQGVMLLPAGTSCGCVCGVTSCTNRLWRAQTRYAVPSPMSR